MDKGTAVEPDFRTALETLFDRAFVVKDFMYKKINIEYAVIATERLIEVRHVTTKEEYAAELSLIGRSGRYSFEKHKLIRQKKFISNAFYFMSPSRLLTADEMPPKYGLIHYNKEGALSFKKYAEFFDPENFLTKNFFQTLSKKLAAELYNIQAMNKKLTDHLVNKKVMEHLQKNNRA